MTGPTQTTGRCGICGKASGKCGKPDWKKDGRCPVDISLGMTESQTTAFPGKRVRIVRPGMIGIAICGSEYVMPVSEANDLIVLIHRTQERDYQRDERERLRGRAS